MVSFTLGRAWEEGVAAIQEGKKKLAAIVMNLVEAKCGKACQFGISGSPRHKQIWHSHACFFPGGGGPTRCSQGRLGQGANWLSQRQA